MNVMVIRRICLIPLLVMATNCFAELQVRWLAQAPILDGRVDSALRHYPQVDFVEHYTFDNPPIDKAAVSYQLGYSAEFLYVYVQTDRPISYHKRSWLYGDGIKLVIGSTDKGNSSDEYYEMVFSLEDKPGEAQWYISNYNFTGGARRLSEASQFEVSADGATSGFELLVPWADLYPYHPWFNHSIGLNLYFAKGYNTEAHNYLTHGFGLVHDEGIWDEEVPTRQLIPLDFSKSAGQRPVQFQPRRRNILLGESLPVSVVGLSNTPSNGSFQVSHANGDVALVAPLDLDVDNGETVADTGELGSGEYQIELFLDNKPVGQYSFAILPPMDIGASRDLIHKVPGLEGAKASLLFRLEEIERAVDELKPYETGSELLAKWQDYAKLRSTLLAGADPFAAMGAEKAYRRAFRSSVDGSWQPYSIKLPRAYDPQKRYPLLVFLHGSGADDQGLLDLPRGNGDYIEIAPFARDKYRAYSSETSQRDILDAISDVSRYFSVNRSKVVIGGFSMGGYGALRTFYQQPPSYCAVAVFAGHPNLASEWLDEPHPNFLETEFAAVLSQVPVFIYHGEADPALDVNLMRAAAEAFKQAGGKVTARFLPQRGHVYQDGETQERYSLWLSGIASGQIPCR